MVVQLINPQIGIVEQILFAFGNALNQQTITQGRLALQKSASSSSQMGWDIFLTLMLGYLQSLAECLVLTRGEGLISPFQDIIELSFSPYISYWMFFLLTILINKLLLLEVRCSKNHRFIWIFQLLFLCAISEVLSFQPHLRVQVTCSLDQDTLSALLQQHLTLFLAACFFIFLSLIIISTAQSTLVYHQDSTLIARSFILFICFMSLGYLERHDFSAWISRVVLLQLHLLELIILHYYFLFGRILENQFYCWLTSKILHFLVTDLYFYLSPYAPKSSQLSFDVSLNFCYHSSNVCYCSCFYSYLGFVSPFQSHCYFETCLPLLTTSYHLYFTPPNSLILHPRLLLLKINSILVYFISPHYLYKTVTYLTSSLIHFPIFQYC